MKQYMEYLVLFIIVHTTKGFILLNTTPEPTFSTRCAVSLPCTCSGSGIYCLGEDLTQVPTFRKQYVTYKTLYIYLDENKLTSIPAYAFKNLSSINTTKVNLYLQNNNISHMDENAFDGIAQAVTILDLDNNKLTQIPACISNLTSLTMLDLQGNPLTSLDGKVLSSISSTLTHFFVDLDHFVEFPTELRHLSRLTTLTIDKIYVPITNSTVFQSFARTLSKLSISYSDFESVPSAFCHLINIKSLTINYSPNLGKNDSTVFQECNYSLPTLTTLDLQYNDLTTFPYFQNLFPSLTTLDLSNNYLHIIDGSLVNSVAALTSLDLSNNNLTRIPAAINKMTNLQDLTIRYNKIESVEDFDIFQLHNLTRLILGDNPLTYISDNAFKYNSLLEYIDVDGTSLDHIPTAVTQLPALKTLYIQTIPMQCSCTSMVYMKTWNISSILTFTAICLSGETVRNYILTALPKCP